MKISSAIFSTLFVSILSASAFAQTAATDHEPLEHLNRGTALNFIHHVNNLEISQANAAMAKLNREDVRKFAKLLAYHHSKNERKLWALATQENVAIYYFNKATYEGGSDDQLMHFSGKHFDRGFLMLQVQGHERALFMLEKLHSDVNDPEIKSFIEETIPTVRKHRDLAKELLEKLGLID